VHRNIITGIAALVIGAATVAGTSAAAGASATSHPRTTKPVTFTGSISCALSGSITASPAFTLSGSKPATLTLHGTLSKCTGKVSQKGVKITGGKVTGKSSVPHNSCSSLVSGAPKLSGTITYIAKGGKVTATKFSFSGGGVGTNKAGNPTVSYPGKGETSKETGSFAGKTGKAFAVISGSVSTLLAACESPAGLSKLTLTKGSTVS
jgi:hypothetical protein